MVAWAVVSSLMVLSLPSELACFIILSRFPEFFKKLDENFNMNKCTFPQIVMLKYGFKLVFFISNFTIFLFQGSNRGRAGEIIR